MTAITIKAIKDDKKFGLPKTLKIGVNSVIQLNGSAPATWIKAKNIEAAPVITNVYKSFLFSCCPPVARAEIMSTARPK